MKNVFEFGAKNVFPREGDVYFRICFSFFAFQNNLMGHYGLV